MKFKKPILLIVSFLLMIVALANNIRAYDQVVIVFFYWDPQSDPSFCDTCEPWLYALEDFKDKSSIIDDIELVYGDEVRISRIPYSSHEMETIKRQYNLTYVPRNSVLINYKDLLKDFEEEDLKVVIDGYLAGTSEGSQPSPAQGNVPLAFILAIAFTFGFFETFSPCLIVLLSFILGYALSDTCQFKKGFINVMVFGLGFVFATILVFSIILFGLITLASFSFFRYVLALSISVFGIFYGFHLLGFNAFNILKFKIETKPLIQKLTGKYVLTYTGLVLLGFLFLFCGSMHSTDFYFWSNDSLYYCRNYSCFHI